MDLDPGTLDLAARYRLLIGCVVPRPIALVSTVSLEGRLNLAPFSFFNGVGCNPMTLLFCPANRASPDEQGNWEKDTLRNAKPEAEGGAGEFVVNIVSERFMRQVAASAEPLKFGESEFELTGLAPAPSQVVRPPRVAESPASFECRTIAVIRTNGNAPSAGNIVIGKVVRVHIDDRVVLNDRMHIDADELAAVGRMGGLGYATTRQRFELPMGRAALDAALDLPVSDVRNGPASDDGDELRLDRRSR
jgi:flavin reductase (DIM6/NTAB) family NADH-FMN oxidoreductase RutF